MLVNGLVNGVLVPVEVAEDELSSIGTKIVEDSIEQFRAEGTMNLKEAFLEYLVKRMDITDVQSERLIDSCEWEEFTHVLLNFEDREFVIQVMNGTMLAKMNEKARELFANDKLFEVEVDLTRKIQQVQTITIVVQAEDEEEARSKLYNMSIYDIRDCIDDDDWEDDGWNSYDDVEIDDWSIAGDADPDDGYPVIEL